MMAELFGKSTGDNRGKGGSMHITDLSKGMLGVNPILGMGARHAVRLRRRERGEFRRKTGSGSWRRFSAMALPTWHGP